MRVMAPALRVHHIALEFIAFSLSWSSDSTLYCTSCLSIASQQLINNLSNSDILKSVLILIALKIG